MQRNIFPALLLTVLCLIVPLSSRAERNTLVFISDLHMNLDTSYAWLKTNAPPLATFINKVNGREDVSELIILGDLLDDWIETVENVPHTFQDILVSSNNAEVVAALQAICRNPDITVTYVAGNHDMLIFEPENKTVITNIIPGLNIIADSPGLGAYTKNNIIWAEHGHRYCMFNAPDTWSRTNSHLPLGYFISRIAASKSERENKVYTTMDALDTLIKSSESYYTPNAGEENVVFNDEFINVLFDTFALVWGGFWPWNTFTMDGTDHYTDNPSVLETGNTFDGIYSNWPDRMDIVHPYEAVWNEVGHLSSAATMLFEMPDRIKPKYPFTPRIVLFGHTHQAAFYYHSDTTGSIYANTGTWVDGKPRTWVEIEINNAGDNEYYTVSLWFDGESAPRQRATLDAPQIAGVTVERDFNGDAKSDLVIYDPASGVWYIRPVHGEAFAMEQWGLQGVIPVAGDYTGDGYTDLAVYDPATGVWYIRPVHGETFAAEQWGFQGAIPVPGDYTGDGCVDLCVYDPATGIWYIRPVHGLAYAIEQWGFPGAIPVGGF